MGSINGTSMSDGGYDDVRETTLTGFVSGSPTSVVVPLVGDLVILLDEYFEDQGQSKEDAEELKKAYELWFGVVDGCQLHGAIFKCQKRWPKKWDGFLWKVFVVRAGLPVEEYRKLAVVQNERCRQANHYEPTMFELLNGLRKVYDSMLFGTSKSKVKFTHRDVAFNYDGGNHDKNTTVKQAVSLAIRLSKRTLDVIGIVSNMACQEMILNNSSLNSRKLTCTNEVLRTYDCRLFKYFLCPSTIRGASNFLNALKEGDEEAQVNTVHRARHWSESNDYKPLKSETLSAQFTFAKRALAEEKKFLRHLESDKWPNCMLVTRNNLLRSTAFDEDLVLNEGNDLFVLESVWELFSQNFPARAKRLGRKLSDGTQVETSSDQLSPSTTESASQDDTPQVSTSNSSGPEESSKDRMLREKEAADAVKLEAVRLKEEQAKREAEERRREAERKRLMRSEADRTLKECGIETHHTTFNRFRKDIWTSSSARFDMILSALPRNCDDKTLESLPSFCKSTLKTGSYVSFVVSEEQFSKLKHTFQAASFKVCHHSYKVHYDPKTVKRKRNADFPQCHDDICFIAKTQGSHPNSFVPDFAICYDKEEIPTATFLSSVFNMNSCQHKLRAPKHNSPVFPEERSVDLFTHLLRLFSPPSAHILDPFGGPLTVSLACFKTNRTCTAIDGSEPGCRYAMGRLRIFATPEKTMNSLESYIDVDAEPSADTELDSFKVETKPIQRESNEQDSTEEFDPSAAHLSLSPDGEDHSALCATQEGIDEADASSDPGTSTCPEQDSRSKVGSETADVIMQPCANETSTHSDNSETASYKTAEENIGVPNTPTLKQDSLPQGELHHCHTTGKTASALPSTRMVTRAKKKQKIVSDPSEISNTIKDTGESNKSHDNTMKEKEVQGADALLKLTTGH